jgi:hypothetical protein
MAQQPSYNEDSQWCQEHGHTGLLARCPLCERFLASLASPVREALEREHNPDGTRSKRNAHTGPPMSNPYDPAENGMERHRGLLHWNPAY